MKADLAVRLVRNPAHRHQQHDYEHNCLTVTDSCVHPMDAMQNNAAQSLVLPPQDDMNRLYCNDEFTSVCELQLQNQQRIRVTNPSPIGLAPVLRLLPGHCDPNPPSQYFCELWQ